ncbi:MAG TPA: aldehyde dehydrogenase family protein [Bdellovibrionales bacterium]|nr:aldehyde dehydrogenase family protein [Bdellovibrionales bacterium]
MSAIVKTHNFIGGEFVASLNGRWIDHINPSTGLKASEVPDSEILDLVRAIQAANKSLVNWQRMTGQERGALLEKIADLLLERRDELSVAQATDTGAPVSAVKEYSIPAAIERFRTAALATKQDFLPVGIASCVTGWSDPIDSLAMRVAPALAAGNAVIAKPSEYSPQSNELFARILHDAGLPPGVFNLVQGRGDSVGHAIAQHPGLHHIAFCGTTETGRLFMSEAAEPLKKLHLSMGSKNPVLVFQNVDLEATAKTVALITTGYHPAQCLRGSRLFIQETIFKDFLAVLQKELQSLKVGDATDPSTQVGPLVHQRYKDGFQAAVKQALGEKGKSQAESDLLGAAGWFVPPMLISDLTYCSTLQQTEVIGPLITATSFKYQHDAVKHANGNPFGHTAYVFESDIEKARKIGRKLEAGQVYLNPQKPPMTAHPQGLKASGLGHKTTALLEFFSFESSTIE